MILYNDDTPLAEVSGPLESLELRTMFRARCFLLRGAVGIEQMHSPHVATGPAAELLLTQPDGVPLAAVVFIDTPNMVPLVAQPDPAAMPLDPLAGLDTSSAKQALIASHAALWEQLDRTTEILRVWATNGVAGAAEIKMLSVNRALLAETREKFGAADALPNNRSEWLSAAGWLGQNVRRDRREVLAKWLRQIGIVLAIVAGLWALAQCSGCASRPQTTAAEVPGWIRTRWMQQEAKKTAEASRGVVFIGTLPAQAK